MAHESNQSPALRRCIRVARILNTMHRTDCTLSISDALRGLRLLVRLVIMVPEHEKDTLWNLENDAENVSLIVGGYWFCTDYYSGHDSEEYATLCALGEVYSPGRHAGPEPETDEVMVYEALQILVGHGEDIAENDWHQLDDDENDC